MTSFFTVKNTVNVGSKDWAREFWLTKTPKCHKGFGSAVWGTFYDVGFSTCFATEGAAKAALTRYKKLYPTEGRFEMCRGYYDISRDAVKVYPIYEMEV